MSQSESTEVTQALIARAGLEDTFSAYPDDVLWAIGDASRLRANFTRPANPRVEPVPTTVLRTIE